MATNTGTDNIDIAPENDDFEAVDVQTNDDDTGDTTGQGNIPAAPAAAGANGPASFNLRVEQNKIPEFFGARTPFPLRLHPTTGGSGQNKPMDGRPDLPPLRQLSPEPSTRVALIYSRLEHR